jgi:hypothetical protein
MDGFARPSIATVRTDVRQNRPATATGGCMRRLEPLVHTCQLFTRNRLHWQPGCASRQKLPNPWLFGVRPSVSVSGGSTGDSPVPLGRPAQRNGDGVDSGLAGRSPQGPLSVSLGESPSETGGSPVLPLLNTYGCPRRRRVSAPEDGRTPPTSTAGAAPQAMAKGCGKTQRNPALARMVAPKVLLSRS